MERCARDTLVANGIWKSSVQKMSGRANAMSELLTAIESSIGSSGGMTELVTKLFSNNLYSLYVGSSKYIPQQFSTQPHAQDFTQACEWVSGLRNWLLTSELCQQNVTQDTCLAGGIYNVKTEGKKPPSNGLKANY
jgi:hypothetical protein